VPERIAATALSTQNPFARYASISVSLGFSGPSAFFISEIANNSDAVYRRGMGLSERYETGVSRLRDRAGTWRRLRVDCGEGAAGNSRVISGRGSPRVKAGERP